jgi:hypothetical protein
VRWFRSGRRSLPLAQADPGDDPAELKVEDAWPVNAVCAAVWNDCRQSISVMNDELAGFGSPPPRVVISSNIDYSMLRIYLAKEYCEWNRSFGDLVKDAVDSSGFTIEEKLERVHRTSPRFFQLHEYLELVVAASAGVVGKEAVMGLARSLKAIVSKLEERMRDKPPHRQLAWISLAIRAAAERPTPTMLKSAGVQHRVGMSGPERPPISD